MLVFHLLDHRWNILEVVLLIFHLLCENVATRHATSLFFQKKQGFCNAKNRDIRENRGIVTVAEFSQRINRDFVTKNYRYRNEFTYQTTGYDSPDFLLRKPDTKKT
jgi:hypothetical protein